MSIRCVCVLLIAVWDVVVVHVQSVNRVGDRQTAQPTGRLTDRPQLLLLLAIVKSSQFRLFLPSSNFITCSRRCRSSPTTTYSFIDLSSLWNGSNGQSISSCNQPTGHRLHFNLPSLVYAHIAFASAAAPVGSPRAFHPQFFSSSSPFVAVFLHCRFPLPSSLH